MNSAEVDASLSEIQIKQLTWKPSCCRNVAVDIVRSFLEDRIQFSDHVPLDWVADADANVIGATWKRLVDAGILAPMGQFKRSEKEASRGRKVFKYRLASEKLAQTFLARNGVTPIGRPQPELALATEGA